MESKLDQALSKLHIIVDGDATAYLDENSIEDAKAAIKKLFMTCVPDEELIEPIEIVFPGIKTAKTATEIDLITTEYGRWIYPSLCVNKCRTQMIKAVELL